MYLWLIVFNHQNMILMSYSYEELAVERIFNFGSWMKVERIFNFGSWMKILAS